MDTGYIMDFTNNEVTYIKDYLESLFTPQEELEMSIAESFNMSHADSEEYAKSLRDKCMAEYRNELIEFRRNHAV